MLVLPSLFLSQQSKPTRNWWIQATIQSKRSFDCQFLSHFKNFSGIFLERWMKWIKASTKQRPDTGNYSFKFRQEDGPINKQNQHFCDPLGGHRRHWFYKKSFCHSLKPNKQMLSFYVFITVEHFFISQLQTNKNPRWYNLNFENFMLYCGVKITKLLVFRECRKILHFADNHSFWQRKTWK